MAWIWKDLMGENNCREQFRRRVDAGVRSAVGRWTEALMSYFTVGKLTHAGQQRPVTLCRSTQRCHAMLCYGQLPRTMLISKGPAELETGPCTSPGQHSWQEGQGRESWPRGHEQGRVVPPLICRWAQEKLPPHLAPFWIPPGPKLLQLEHGLSLAPRFWKRLF